MLRVPRSVLDAATDFPRSAAVKLGPNDYDVANRRSIVPDDRLTIIVDLLRQKSAILLTEAEAAKIHPAAPAAAIAWEFAYNVMGWSSDLALPISKQDGYGYGSFHRSALRKFQPLLNEEELNAVRTNLGSAINQIARYIAQRRDDFLKLSGIDISDWPEGLVWLYNSSIEYTDAVAREKANTPATKTRSLAIVNNMASWTHMNLSIFRWLQPKVPLPASQVSYTRSVSPVPSTAFVVDPRFNPFSLPDLLGL